MSKLFAISIIGLAVFLGAIIVEVTRRSAEEPPLVPAKPRAGTGQMESD
jgi:hypothetical protein